MDKELRNKISNELEVEFKKYLEKEAEILKKYKDNPQDCVFAIVSIMVAYLQFRFPNDEEKVLDHLASMIKMLKEKIGQAVAG